MFCNNVSHGNIIVLALYFIDKLKLDQRGKVNRDLLHPEYLSDLNMLLSESAKHHAYHFDTTYMNFG